MGDSSIFDKKFLEMLRIWIISFLGIFLFIKRK